MVKCDCCGRDVDERSLQSFITKFVCTSCLQYSVASELAEKLYNVDIELGFNIENNEYCAVVEKDGNEYCGNADSAEDAVGLAIRNMLEGQ